jgi:hypothetical protein
VVSQPGKAKGRGRTTLEDTPVTMKALEWGVGEEFIFTPLKAREVGRGVSAAGRRHATGREMMGARTLQTLQYPILLMPARWRLSKPAVQGSVCTFVRQ